MKLRLPWYVKLPGIILFLTGPIAASYTNPYFLWGGKVQEAQRREKGYHMVRYKSKDNVKVHTKESEALYAQLENGLFPEPVVSRMASNEEIQENGLYVLGAKLVQKEEVSEE